MRHEEVGMEADLVDLGGLSLDDLKELDDSALGHALRRVLADADGPGDAIAAFQSYLDGQG
jgi:FXSXX-COOH protein